MKNDSQEDLTPKPFDSFKYKMPLSNDKVIIKDFDYKSDLLNISVDSFKWRMPLVFVKVLNTDLLDYIIHQKVNQTTGALISEEQIQNNSLKVLFDFYHIHFAISHAFGNEDLVILINSKLLEQRYTQGITMLNIEFIYKKIISCGVIDISFEDFLTGSCSDIDFKKDIEIENNEEFNPFTLKLKQSSRPNSRSKIGYNRFYSPTNQGIEWNQRAGSSYAHPFLKIYHKGVEAKHGDNKLYFSKHIDTNQISNRVRIEVTIKNKEMAKRFGIKGMKLHEILSIGQDKLHEIINHSIVRNLEPRIPSQTPRSINKLSPTDKILFQSITLALHNDMSFDNALNYLLDLFDGTQEERNAKARQKKKLTKIYEEQIKGEIYADRAIRNNAFFSQIGWE